MREKERMTENDIVYVRKTVRDHERERDKQGQTERGRERERERERYIYIYIYRVREIGRTSENARRNARE